MTKINSYKIDLAEVENNGIALISCDDRIFNTQEAALSSAEEMSKTDGKNYLVVGLETKKQHKTAWFIAGAVSAVAVVAAGVVFGIKLVKSRRLICV
ncbi:MAG: hypothetical protein UIM53_02950 [Acutalibacteraceae bacterium]|nr:hypothetical protein [Acutalibacteraceae bacterium]